ncbi:MAG: hypothetical protein AB7O65_09630 [Candidatus Korobacteraceae bacterium]
MLNLYSSPALVLVFSTTATVALLTRALRRWHLRSGFQELEQTLEGLPFRLKHSAKRFGSNVLIKNRYLGRSVEIKFSSSDYEPELQVRLDAAVGFGFNVIRRNPSAEAIRVVDQIQTGDVYFDRRFEIRTSNPEALRRLFLAKSSAGLLKKLCYSTSLFRIHKGVIEAAYSIAPRHGMLLKEDLDAMSALADTFASQPEPHREKAR